MKWKRTIHCCISKDCGWEETSHKIRDALECPKCNGPTINYYPKEVGVGN